LLNYLRRTFDANDSATATFTAFLNQGTSRPSFKDCKNWHTWNPAISVLGINLTSLAKARLPSTSRSQRRYFFASQSVMGYASTGAKKGPPPLPKKREFSSGFVFPFSYASNTNCMLIGYIDDSGSVESNFVTLACLVSHGGMWQFSQLWNAVATKVRPHRIWDEARFPGNDKNAFWLQTRQGRSPQLTIYQMAMAGYLASEMERRPLLRYRLGCVVFFVQNFQVGNGFLCGFHEFWIA
jgi:hypothetical protein